MASEFSAVSIFAWVGGNGKVMAMYSPEGVLVPLIGQDGHRTVIDIMKPLLEDSAKLFGKKLRLVRFDFAELIDETTNGE